MKNIQLTIIAVIITLTHCQSIAADSQITMEY